MCPIQLKLDDRQDKVVGLIQRVQNLILGDGNRRRAFDAPLYLQEAQFALLGSWLSDIIAELLELTLDWLEAQAALDLHDNRPRTAAACLSTGCCTFSRTLPVIRLSRPADTTTGAAYWASRDGSTSRGRWPR
jgi:hypothetical protein